MYCKVCDGGLKLLLQYNNVPRGAQVFPTKETWKEDKGIDLDIYQCLKCGLVQLDIDPVPYYKRAIRSTSKKMDEFRKEQLNKFIKKFNLGGKVIINIIEDLDYIPKIDAFTMFNFLEHLPDPNLTLTRIKNSLSTEGVGIIEVPNFDMILQENLFSEFIRDHLFYFTKDTLDLTLRLNGFKVLDIKSIWMNYILSARVVKPSEIDISGFKMTEEGLKQDIHNYINKFNSIAVWGAGHQSLTLLALFNLIDQISYIVDSSSSKQGRYTPVTHIPIVSPEMLKVAPVEAVLVIVAGYIQEVLEQIKLMKISSSIAIINGVRLEVING